jgi:ComF family protein
MNIIDTTLSLIAPHICVSCGTEGAVLCKACSLSLPTLPSICYVCAKATKQHAACSRHAVKHSPTAVYIAAEYSNEIKAAIHAYKFDYKRSAAKDLAFFMNEPLPYLDEDTIITYVPAVGAHIRERGFDNMRLLAKEVATIQKRPVKRLLSRVTSVTQKGANKHTRKKQLVGAFRAENVTGMRILLIDDVVTTGATLEACTKLLYAAGAKNVTAAVIARTP